MLSVKWQPCWAQVVSAGWNRCAVRAWQVRHSTSLRAVESDSRWVRCPAVVAIRFHVSFAGPVTWHSSQVSRGTLPCGGIVSGRSVIQAMSSLVWVLISNGWQA